MKFEGNLSKFFPPDLLIFLANLGKEGVLTVTNNNDFLSISFKNGAITDAHSKSSDEKLLKILYLHKYIKNDQYKHITQVRKETGIDVLQILEKLELFSFSKIEYIILDGIKEVLFRFFLLKNGEFKFSDIHVDTIRPNSTLLPHAIAIEIASWIDEWQEIERTRATFDRLVTLSDHKKNTEEIDGNERILLSIIRNGKTIRELIDQSPMLSYTALKTVENAIRKKWLTLHQPEKIKPSNGRHNKHGELFYEYKKAFKKIISTKNSIEKIKSLIGFCKDHFDQTFIISTTKSSLLRCVVFFKDVHGNLKSKEIRNVENNIDNDPVFSRAYNSGFSFFGNIFPAKIIKNIIVLPETGECAVIPLGKKDDRMNLIYTVSTKTVSEIGSFHYLELLSWLIKPETDNVVESGQSRSIGKQPSDSTTTNTEKKDVSLSEIIDDLPPMPHLASKMLQLLSDPDSSIDDLTKVLAQDQSMMATLMKVSNSALYRTGEEISTLNNAVTRLGFKTIRSLVLTATTHSLFPRNNPKLEVMSQTLWQHSKECGLASRRAAEIIGYNDPEEAFVAGLLHDIGKLAILIKFTDDYNRIIKMQRADTISSIEAEREVLGFDHIELGVALMDRWKIPGNLSACVKHHHDPQASDQFRTLTHIVALGDYLSHLHGISSNETKIDHSVRLNSIITELKLSDDDIDHLKELAIEDFKQSDIFD